MAGGPFDQCDQVEEELGRAQSKPTHANGIRSRLDTGSAHVPKWFIWLLRVLLSVPLEQLTD